MKTTSFRRPLVWAAGIAGFVALLSMSVHPSGSVKGTCAQAASARDLHVSREAAPLLKRACMDCHSNQTVWPWYSYVAPMSWLVETDVHRGRERVNFSEWDQYTFEQRSKLLAEIASAVKNREMPLRRYTIIHGGARLSDADTDALYAWARVERRKLRAMRPLVPAGARQGGDSR